MTGIAVPLSLLLLLLWAVYKKTDVFSAFLQGAAGALPLLASIVPCMAAMMVAISVLRDSGVLSFIIGLLSPLCGSLGLDSRLLPLLLLRPFSGSAASAVAADIYRTYGADSLVGHLAGVLMGASETLFYTLALYFGSVGIRKSRYAIPAALLCTLVAAVAGIFFGTLFYPGS